MTKRIVGMGLLSLFLATGRGNAGAAIMMNPRVAIYCRVSTNKQEQDGTSLETQLAKCEAYAAEQGW